MIRVVGRDKAGIVILRDHRPDGSYILLVCQEFQPAGGGGVLGLPDEEEFPMLRAAVDRTMMLDSRMGKEQFSLEVDISAMPRGELRFNSREFIEQAVEKSVSERAEITPDNAASWGFIGAGREERG